jgi:hypothetical protein
LPKSPLQKKLSVASLPTALRRNSIAATLEGEGQAASGAAMEAARLQEETAADEVDVWSGTVGIPLILTSPHDGKDDIFSMLVAASETELDLIAADAMRAVIAFKWKAFGR